MKQEYFVLVVAHSLRGRLRRVHIPHQAIYIILGLALLGCFSVFGFLASYGRMVLKVANYNALKREAEGLRSRYENLQKVVSETNKEMATLQLYAREINMAFGIKQSLEGPADIGAEGKLVPTFAESVQDYDFLKSGRALALPSRGSRRLLPFNERPSIWPVDGPLMRSAFGTRTDPFSGEGAFHTGVDISASMGATVRATAAGIVVNADFESGYGRLVVIDHGNGLRTYYAHLSRFSVRTGQEVRCGDQIGLVGMSGRTSGPHLHYEVRVGGSPRNPAPYLRTAQAYRAPRPASDLF
jgi:murein DD-endopeptidase MepM/ murein hydrolase activator NlpD